MLLLLFAFIAVQLVVAFALIRSIRSEDDFLLAGRKLGPSLATVSIFATWFGAESCIGAAGAAYERGFTWNAPEPFAYGACLIFTGLFFAARLWRLRITTMADFLATRFGSSTERLAALADTGWPPHGHGKCRASMGRRESLERKRSKLTRTRGLCARRLFFPPLT